MYRNCVKYNTRIFLFLDFKRKKSGLTVLCCMKFIETCHMESIITARLLSSKKNE